MNKIGIVGWKVGDNSFGVTVPYLEFLRNSIKDADVVTLMPWSAPQELDLLVLPGGPDINPLNYGEIPDLSIQKSCPFREGFDRLVLPEYIASGTPVFGICRGMQALAVHFGAKLYQNMYHETNDPHKRWDRVHVLEMQREASYILGLKLGKKEYKVNSLHHQSVREETLPQEMIAIGKHPDCPYGGVEVVVHTELPIAGVQYHPEELGFDQISLSIIEKLLNRQPVLTEETVEESITA